MLTKRIIVIPNNNFILRFTLAELYKLYSRMNVYNFVEGNVELLNQCQALWELFISNQIENAGNISIGVEEYIRSFKDGGLLRKTQGGKLYVQLIFVKDRREPIGFCITSLTKELVGEVEALYVMDRYQGNKLGGQLFKNALAWMKNQGVIEEKLIVVTGNEKVYNFYAKYGFFPAYSTLYRVL